MLISKVVRKSFTLIHNFTVQFFQRPFLNACFLRKFRVRIEKLTKNMAAAFDRPTCGFFDPSIPKGGPDLHPELNPRMKQRKPVNAATNRVRRNTHANRRQRSRRDGDLVKAPIRKSGDNMLKYTKSKPLLGIQEILIGYRQWSERYINECHGQRGFKYISSKGQKYIRNVFQRPSDSRL